MVPLRFAILLAVALLTGCTHRQLTRSTVLTSTTVMDIQYRMVLTNLAMLSCHPEALPSHLDLADGVVQVNDAVGFGNSGGFTIIDGGFGIERYGPDGQRQVTEQWGADATTHPERLVALQDLYRLALGLQPLPPPAAIAYLRERRAEQSKSNRTAQEQKIQQLGGKESSGGGGSTPSTGGSENGDKQIPIEILMTDVPPVGWFGLGGKRDVPRNACYVGKFGDRYAWVMPEGMPSLSRFTVAVLCVIKVDPVASVDGRRGLAFTR